MELKHSFSGEIESEYEYLRTHLLTPGSGFNPGAQNPDYPDEPLIDENTLYGYPIYNEILGVYTLLEKPILNITKGRVRFEQSSENNGLREAKTTYRRAIELDKSSVKIALNPASHLNLVDAYFQIQYKGTFNNPVHSTYLPEHANLFTAEITEQSGGVELSPFLWKSAIYPLACSDNIIVNLEHLEVDNWNVPNSQFSQSATDNITDLEYFLTIILHLENENNEKFVHLGTWDTQNNTLNYLHSHDVYHEFPTYGSYSNKKFTYGWNWWHKPEFQGKYHYSDLLGQPEDVVIDILPPYTVYDPSATAMNSIKIVNYSVGYFPNAEKKFVSGGFIEILESNEIPENNTFEIDFVGKNCTSQDFPLASTDDIESICNSYEYRASKFNYRKYKQWLEDSAKTVVPLEFKIYPNPANQFVMVAVEGAQNSEQEWVIDIQDLSGRIISSKCYSLKEDKVRIDVSAYKAGVYMLHTRAGTQSKVHKVVVQH